MTKRIVIFGIIVVVVGVILYKLIPRPPRSLSQAVLEHKDEFPKPQYVLLPPSTQSRLGREPEGALTEDRRITTKPTPCFFVAPSERKGLNRIDVSYNDSRQLSADLRGVVDSVGVNVHETDTATMSLTNIKIVEALGVPILSGACDFSKSRTYEVVTSEIVAGTARLKFDRSIAVTGAGGTGSAPGGTVPGPGANATAGWHTTSDGFIQGENIVISGAVTRVDVSVAGEPHDLGTSPPIGETSTFPGGVGATVVIDGFDDSARTLTLRVDVQLGANQAPPPGLKTCDVRSSITLRPGERCDFWLPTGNALVAAQWGYKTVDGVRHVVMDLTTYRTTFAPPPAPAPASK